jgi:hypothetical protein
MPNVSAMTPTMASALVKGRAVSAVETSQPTKLMYQCFAAGFPSGFVRNTIHCFLQKQG